MADSKIHALKATSMLKEDHQKVKALFAKYQKLGDQEKSAKKQIYDQVSKELTIHATIEEEIFYPAVQEAKDKGAEETVAEALEEHKIVKTLLAELTDLTPSDDSFDAKMKVLGESVLHHAGEEETDMFPIFEKLPQDIRDEVSEKLRARKEELAGEKE